MPLTLALVNVSSPSLNAVDTLSRLSHDTDIRVAQNAVLALGEHTLALLATIETLWSTENRGLCHILDHIALSDMGPAAISCHICSQDGAAYLSSCLLHLPLCEDSSKAEARAGPMNCIVTTSFPK